MQKLLMTSLIGILLVGSGRGASGFLHQAPPGGLPHVFQVAGGAADTHIALLPGGETSLDVLFTAPGEYTLICPTPTHPEQGMRGSIVVR
jgi:plastocyanin